MKRLHQSRREEILDHALDVIQEVGLGNLTMQKIADQVGFTQPALFKHFASKEELVLGLMDRLEELLLLPIEEIAADKSRPPIERIEAILRHHMDLIEERNSLPILLLAEASASESKPLLKKMREIHGRYLLTLERLSRRLPAVNDGRRRPKHDCVAMLLMGIPSAFAIRNRLRPKPDTKDRILKNLIPFVLETLCEDWSER